MWIEFDMALDACIEKFVENYATPHMTKHEMALAMIRKAEELLVDHQSAAASSEAVSNADGPQ